MLETKNEGVHRYRVRLINGSKRSEGRWLMAKYKSVEQSVQ